MKLAFCVGNTALSNPEWPELNFNLIIVVHSGYRHIAINSALLFVSLLFWVTFVRNYIMRNSWIGWVINVRLSFIAERCFMHAIAHVSILVKTTYYYIKQWHKQLHNLIRKLNDNSNNKNSHNRFFPFKNTCNRKCFNIIDYISVIKLIRTILSSERIIWVKVRSTLL